MRRRVIIAKLGLDGHDRGAKVVAMIFRDAGYEVIYTGLRRSPEAVAMAAVQEDVDLVGVSLLSGAHLTLVPKLIRLMEGHGCHVPVLLGGIIPDVDRPKLIDAGVSAVFSPGDGTETILAMADSLLAGRAAGGGMTEGGAGWI